MASGLFQWELPTYRKSVVSYSTYYDYSATRAFTAAAQANG